MKTFAHFGHFYCQASLCLHFSFPLRESSWNEQSTIYIFSVKTIHFGSFLRSAEGCWSVMCYSLMLLEVERSDEPFHADVKILGGWDYFRAFALLCTSARDFISATAAVLPTVSGSDVGGESVDNNSCQPGKASADGRFVVRLRSSWHEGGSDTLSQSPWRLF